MKLYLGTAAESKDGKCFFCGSKIDIERGQKICSVDIDRRSLESEVENHVFRSCATMSDRELEEEAEKRIENLRSRAEEFNSVADNIEERKDDGEFERIWRPSVFD